MSKRLSASEVFGLIHPGIDAHTLGISSVQQLLTHCGYRVIIAGAEVCDAVNQPTHINNIALLRRWIRQNKITRLGFSYRLDEREGADTFGRLLHQLRRQNLLEEQGGPLRTVYFAGLPGACHLVHREHGEQVQVFYGDETPSETLVKLGVPADRIPNEVKSEASYDDMRLQFAKELLHSGNHREILPVDRRGYLEFGTKQDTVVHRIRHGTVQHLPPLMRAHVGPYLPDRVQAVQLFLDWCKQLAQGGYLDVLSIGTSQLSQSHFGADWEGMVNGGGVPINAREEFRMVWEAARPMLVRTYAGTRNIPQLAKMYEETIHIAWHALSFWWFCQIDGRGPYPVKENLKQHLDTLKFIAESGKPFEPNIPHHFAFRGADDISYVVSSVLAARTAKRLGVNFFILQVMLNTPKYTWGIQDLAKARALLHLVRELEDERFQVFLQPRAGLDYFSHDLEKARIQLAAVSAMMDDIEPENPFSPPVVHVVSYSEASHLADPPVINESIQITRCAIEEYRRKKQRGEVELAFEQEVQQRTQELVLGARSVLNAIESSVSDPYTADGLHLIFKAGFLPVPYLWEGRDEFPEAVRWRTQVLNGGVKVVDEAGVPIEPHIRAQIAAEYAKMFRVANG